MFEQIDQDDKLITWTFPDDPSVDLAATPVNYSDDLYDHAVIPSTLFVTDDDLQKNSVVEGEPVLYANTLEPIVRSGTLAMLPTEPNSHAVAETTRTRFSG
jgi:hypothetical protein